MFFYTEGTDYTEVDDSKITILRSSIYVSSLYYMPLLVSIPLPYLGV